MNQLQFALSLRSNQTEVEKLMWFHLRNRQFGFKFRRQQPIGPYIVDFVCLERKLILELDGGEHNLAANTLKDEKRSEFLLNEGFSVLRFWNNELV